MHRSDILSFTCIALLALLTPAACSADTVEYTVSVNTSLINSQTGYVDMQFDGGVPSSQAANAYVSYFYTDGTLQPLSSPSYPFAGTIGDITGSLPNGVAFDNGQSNNIYTQGIAFGTHIQFYLTLSGDALNTPNGNGGGSFFLDFFDTSGNQLLSDSFGGLEIDINPDGTTTTTLFPYSGNGGNPVASLSGVPEPSSLLLLAGSLPLLALCLYKRALH